MIVRHLRDIEGVDGGHWLSRRLLLRRDGMGFSLHDTVLEAGVELKMWYKHHVEAVYVIEGTGSIETLSDGQVYELEPGSMYALDQNDQHILRPRTQMRAVCVFNPPLSGGETHQADGSYPLIEQ